MLTIAKKLLKKPFNFVGLDIRRLNPSVNYGWLIKRNIATVFDIGANIGQFAMMIHKILPHAAIFSFEPIKECYTKLVANMIKAPKFYAFNYALGNIDIDMKMYVNEHTTSSSLLPMSNLHKEAFPHTVKEKMGGMKVKQLDRVAQGFDFNDNMLVKIDVQGYEDKVIEGGRNIISRAEVVIVETNFKTLYIGSPLFEDIYSILRGMGFKYAGELQQLKNPFDGGVLQADSIFLKNRT